jgi:dTDP-4-dehydrorhamnose reductase
LVETAQERCFYSQVDRMKVLITGSSGMLGWDLVKRFQRDYEVVGMANVESQELKIPFYKIDLTSQRTVQETIIKEVPQLIIHAAAFTDVDACESSQDIAFAVNANGTRWVAEAAKKIGASLYYISTDYVYDGKKPEPYEESDAPNPKSIYGKSKLQGERIIEELGLKALVIRTSWLFGWNGQNFFRAILKKMAAQETIQVVQDQMGAPTYTKDLADAMFCMIEKYENDENARSLDVIHFANSGTTNWFEAAKALQAHSKSQSELRAIPSGELNRLAPRPKNSVLQLGKLRKQFGLTPRSWRSALNDYWDQYLEKEWQELNNLKQDSLN